MPPTGTYGLGDAENPKGHHAASRAEAVHSHNRRFEMPGGLPDRDSFVSLADPYVMVAQKALGGHVGTGDGGPPCGTCEAAPWRPHRRATAPL
jgi:hypothetical protein